MKDCIKSNGSNGYLILNHFLSIKENCNYMYRWRAVTISHSTIRPYWFIDEYGWLNCSETLPENYKEIEI